MDNLNGLNSVYVIRLIVSISFRYFGKSKPKEIAIHYFLVLELWFSWSHFEKRFACFPNIIITNHNNHHQHFVGSIFCSNYKLCFTNFSVIKFSEICSINFMVASYSSSLPYVVISFIIIIQWINHGVENSTFNCNCLLHVTLK